MEKDPLRWKWELSVKALHADQQRRDVEKYQCQRDLFICKYNCLHERCSYSQRHYSPCHSLLVVSVRDVMIMQVNEEAGN